MQKKIIRNKAYILVETLVSLVIISISFFTLTLYSASIYKNIQFFSHSNDIQLVKNKLNNILEQPLIIQEYQDHSFEISIKKMVEFNIELFKVSVKLRDITLKSYTPYY